MATATVAGIKFSDTLAALLDHATGHGFRVEPDTRGGSKAKPNAVVVYAPDKTVQPISVSERNARFNKAHYENVRRELYRAGCPPLPADLPTSATVIAAHSREEAVAKAPKGASVVALGDLLDPDLDVENLDIEACLRDPEGAAALLGLTVEGMVTRAGYGKAEADLIAGVAHFAMSWASKFSRDRIHEGSEAVHAKLEAKYLADIKAATDLAAEAEKRVAAADRAADRAAAAEKKAREDCGAALRRAEEAEAKARHLEAALAPLRAVLASTEG